jgi:hypothetical protein
MSDDISSEDILVVQNNKRKSDFLDESDEDVVLVSNTRVNKENQQVSVSHDRGRKASNHRNQRRTNTSRRRTRGVKNFTTAQYSTENGFGSTQDDKVDNSEEGKILHVKDVVIPQETSSSLKDDVRYEVIVKVGTKEKKYRLNETDTLEAIYRDIFGKDTSKKLKYQNVSLSRYSTLKGIGFSEDDKYLYADEPPQEYIMKIKINYGFSKSIVLEVENEVFVSEMLEMAKREVNNDSFNALIMNGYLLNREDKVCDVLFDGDVLDLITI